MKTGGKIFGSMLFIAGILGLIRILRTSSTGKKISLALTGIDKGEIKNGGLVITVSMDIDNPTSYPLKMRNTFVELFLNDESIANSQPSSDVIEIKANDMTNIKVAVKIPFIKLASQAITLVSGKIPKLSLDVAVRALINGLPYYDKKNFKNE